MMLIQALTLAHLSHGPPAPGASWQSWSQEPRFLNQRVVFSRLPRELGTADTGDFRDMSHNVTKTSSGMLTGNENPDLLMTKL